MAIELIDKIKPKNNGTFAMVDAEDVAMPDGTRLSEYNPGNGLPDVTDSDNGKVLGVVGGEWQSVTPNIPNELPNVSTSDNGKVLGVVGGKWQSVTPDIPNELPDVTDSDNGNVLAVVGGKWQSVVPEIPDELPDVSAEDENKILQVVGGKIVLVKVDDSSVKTFVDEYISSALEGDY